MVLSCVAGLGSAAVGACGSDDAAELRRAQLAEGCLLNTDCKSPLVCAFRTCHVECTEQRDCPDGELCVPTDKPFKVCMFESEQKCTYNSDCPSSFKCVVGKCRPECKLTTDCVPDQVCAEYSCAVPADVNAGGGLIKPDGTSPDASVGQNCVHDSDCPGFLICLAGACNPECVTDKDCPGSSCDQNGRCIVGGLDGGSSACQNGVKDPAESDVDCGGACGACAGAPCTKPSDCASDVCTAQKCAAPSCADGLQNGAESDVDCGGQSCPKCPAPKGCWTASDCAEGKCAAGVCTTAGCSDGTQSGNETDIDCGGGQCSGCADGKGCGTNADCKSANCVNKLCKPAGPTTWVEAMTGTPRVAADPTGNLVVAGMFITGQNIGGVSLSSAGGNDLFIGKFTPAGAPLWVGRQGGTGSDQLEEVAVDSKGNVIVVGTTTNGASFSKPLSCPNAGLFVIKYSADKGTEVWSRCVSIPASQAGGELFGLAVDAADNVYVGGRFYGTLDFGGSQLYDANWQGYLAKYSGVTGSLAWAKELTVSSGSSGAPVRALTGDGTNIVAVGDFASTLDLGGIQLVSTSTAADVYVARFSGVDGAVQQAKRFGDSGIDNGRDIARDGTSGIIVTGAFVGQVDFGAGPVVSKGAADTFLLKLDAVSLSTTWAKGFGSSGDDRGISVATASSGEIALAAEITGAVDFGGGPVVHIGQTDLVLARFSSQGAHLASKGWGYITVDTPTSVVWVGSAVGLAGKYTGGTLDFGTGPLSPTKTGFFAHLVP